MTARIVALAGQAASASMLIDVDKLVSAYHKDVPDPAIAAQRVAFGTSGHRGSAFDRSFNEWHVLAITQAICHYRKAHGIAGPLFLGIDTHALSQPACASALEVLAANGVDVRRYAALAVEFGSLVARRVQAPATAQEKAQLAALKPEQITATELAGERIERILTHAPGNGELIGGIKVNTASGWFAARPSGTEDIYKIYGESFLGTEHLQDILQQAQAIVDAAILSASAA